MLYNAKVGNNLYSKSPERCCEMSTIMIILKNSSYFEMLTVEGLVSCWWRSEVLRKNTPRRSSCRFRRYSSQERDGAFSMIREEQRSKSGSDEWCWCFFKTPKEVWGCGCCRVRTADWRKRWHLLSSCLWTSTDNCERRGPEMISFFWLRSRAILLLLPEP